MKKAILLSMALMMSLVVTAQGKKKLVDITFKTSITCDHCVTTIMSSLPLEKGVKGVKCNLDTKEVKVTINTDKTDSEKIKRSLEKLGYVAKEVKDDIKPKEKQE